MIRGSVPEKPDDKRPRGPLRAFSEWLRGETPPPPPARTPGPAGPGADDTPVRDGLPVRIGHYRIVGKLGQGGMGIVYAARDERLERAVALKTMSSVSRDETARKRFWREARAAASVNHPNVCQLYEIGEDSGELFIAMELLEGRSLATRLQEGPMSVSETVPLGLGMLSALQALHARGVVHRDLKPSNVFLTPHGVKVLDFGLALPGESGGAPSDATPLTQTGMIVGTPRYMAPEQVTGEALDARSDLFAAGAILFEMLAGRPAFNGRNAVEILHATLHEQPPALTGSPAVAAVDRVIRRALSKRPADRPPSADVMAEELRAVRGVLGDDTPALARALTRIVVLPFRVLRPDPETDFLAFSLPDAVATSLSGIRSLVVRSSATAARFAGDAPDLKVVAAEADVDRVVTGTLLRAGDQLRVSTQLVEAPGGTLLSSHTVQASLGDLFHLQDDMARRLVEALSLPLGGGPPSPTPDAPKDARAYELFLRANELARNYDQLPAARDLYLRCLELDPKFAPAWARLGRCHWVIAKYFEDAGDSAARAEEAFRRALELNPRLSLGHTLYAQFEADTGHSLTALVRLLEEGRRHGNDPELFAGLVYAARYCGLYEQSLAAHEEARRLDPNVVTSVGQTILMTGDLERLLALEHPPNAPRGHDITRAVALGMAGRRDEARRLLEDLHRAARLPAFQAWLRTLLAWVDRRAADMIVGLTPLGSLKIAEDPEAIFEMAWLLCDVGEHERGLAYLRRAVDRGYYAVPTLAGSPQFDALRADPAFRQVLADAEAGREKARTAYREAGGERLLGFWAEAFDRLDAMLRERLGDEDG
jgi:eukaryotic-like serine/threonine-protein kinase